MRSFGAYKSKSALLATVTVGVGLLSAAPALAGSGPIWSIQSAAVPASMQTSDDAGALVAVDAEGGTFTLSFEGQTTVPIAYDASSPTLESALDALSSIGGVGGSAIVKGGHGGPLADRYRTVEYPYGIMFAGKLHGVSAATMTADNILLRGSVHTVAIEAATNDEYDVHVENIGDTASSGAITFTDKLPSGVTTTGTSVSRLPPGSPDFTCSTGAGLSEVECTGTPSIPAGVSNSYDNLEASLAEGTFAIAIPVKVAPDASGSATNTATVSGGGAVTSASVSASNPVNSATPPAFGVSYFNAQVSNEAGAPFTQAGGHPYGVTVNFGFNQEIGPGVVGAAPQSEENGAVGAADGDEAREIMVDLPLGLIGNPLAVPRCPLNLVTRGTNMTACPRDTQVGIVYLGFFAAGPNVLGPYALFNVVPEPGRPGEFAFSPIAGDTQVLYGTVVRTPLGNVVRVVAQVSRAQFHSFSATFFGNPIETFAQPGEDEEQLPFLINPTNCEASEAQRTFSMHVDSWYHPGALNPDGTPDFSDPNWKEASTVVPPVEGCNQLEFNPSHFELAPSGLLEGAHEPAAGGTTQADKPSAYEGRLKIPQLETFGTLSRPELKSATVTLPAGLSVSASAANGLEGCTEAQLDPASGEPGHCPEGSKLGTVEVATPLLSKPLDGHVYLAEPKCGEESEPACVESEAEEGKLFGLIIQLDGEAVVKIPGYVEAGGYGAYSAAHGLAPGQLRAVFPNDPQVPFGELVFKFKEGPRTPLANPQTCGTFTTSSLLEPWSAPFSASATSESSFGVNWDGHGGACPAGMPFSPGFTAGTASSAAGAYSPLVLEFSRQDREQDLSTISVHTPPGMLGNLSGVPLCGEPQASQGACGEGSLIGSTSAVVGPGEDPFTITGGRVYLTGPYKGQPFGLSIVVPANAGPFHLGNVVVRASIAVDPHTAALTVTTDALPQVVDSVPIRLRKVVVDVDRPGFIFNATDCAARKVEATLTGLEGFTGTHGSSASVASSYSANGCASLAFKPKFAVSTAGKTSRAKGASLSVKLTYPSGPSYANIKAVKVDLPKQLPSRLTTLQKACVAAVFEANPANCPKESIVGTAKATTPILPVALEGPAYFVSHGGEAFPSLIVVLQGYGVTLDLVGTTFISKKGITSSTFKTVPDAPVGSFDLTLPEGKFSALAANGNLCTSKLAMPTAFVGQNGAEIHESTKIGVTGCSTGISIVSHKIKGRMLTVSVSVPAAGILTASGKGLSRSSKSAKGRETLTFKLTQKKPGKLRTTVKVTYTPSTGKDRTKQAKSAKLTFKR
ncbi:MAG TPA: hypothetical protein VII53_10580 [Solirubrobacteraceae bacterium]